MTLAINDAPPAPVTPGASLTRFATQRPEADAVVYAALDGTREHLTWRELEQRANRLARRLAHEGVKQGDYVAIGLPNGVDHVVAAQATWKLGGCAMPVGVSLPEAERRHILDLAHPAAVVADWPGAIGSAELAELADRFSDEELGDDPVPAPFKAIASGGSTGSPKLIVSPGAFAYPGGIHPLGAMLDLRDADIALSPGPLYHNQAFLFTTAALYTGATAIICERFRPDQVLGLIEESGVTYLNVVPTMMGRMLREPSLAERDLSSLRVLLHMAAPCPEWVKRGWIDRLGAEHVYELWAATELTGITIIRGDEWLAHPGSVGKPIATEMRIIGPDGEALPAGDVGEIYSKMLGGDGPSYDYLGSQPLPTTEDGFVSVGDMGFLDADGYLHLADRRTDLIISNGANVYPAEVEDALSAHPAVADVVVVGLPDDDLGQRVHAIVQPSDPDAPPEAEDLNRLVAERLAKYKWPRDYEFVPELPRAESGKIRRGALRDERV